VSKKKKTSKSTRNSKSGKVAAKKRVTAKPAKKSAATVKAAAKKTATKKIATKKVESKPAKKIAKAAKSNERIGVLGGAFNPMHIGHLNSALTVRDQLKLDKVLLIPALNPPHRQMVGPSAEDRLAMVQAGIKAYQPELEASDLEIKRGGTSYTVDTLTKLNETYKPENIHFIMGADAFQEFARWKDFPRLIKLANFVVTTRPGSDADFSISEMDNDLANHIEKSDDTKLELDSGRAIYKVTLEDISVSATEIRKRLRNNQNARELLPPPVLNYIESNNLYKRTSPLVADYREFALVCGKRALDKKALALKVYDMSKKNSYADYSVICSSTSSRHASAIAEGIIDSVRDDFGLRPISIEGAQQGLWVLIDYGSVVIHVFQDHVRDQYRLEGLWRDCPQIQGEIMQAPAKQAPARTELRNS
jgi:nicotinate-nucleotide adenylyltransferase